VCLIVAVGQVCTIHLQHNGAGRVVAGPNRDFSGILCSPLAGIRKFEMDTRAVLTVVASLPVAFKSVKGRIGWGGCNRRVVGTLCEREMVQVEMIPRPIDLKVVREWDGTVLGPAVDLETVRDPVGARCDDLRAIAGEYASSARHPARKPRPTFENTEPKQEKQRPSCLHHGTSFLHHRFFLSSVWHSVVQHKGRPRRHPLLAY